MALSETLSTAGRAAAKGLGAGGRLLRSELGLALTVVAGFAAFAYYALLTDSVYDITLMTKAALLGLAAIGLNLALGSGGLVSLGHAAFFGAGGYVAGVLAINAFNGTPAATWPFEIAGTNQMIVIWLAAIVIGGLLALVIGALSLRSSGVYFIMITLAFAQMLFFLAISWTEYGGEDGFNFFIRNEFLCLPGMGDGARAGCLNTMDPFSFGMISLGVIALVLIFISTLLRSRFGLALEVSRQNPDRLQAIGVSPFPIRLVAFAISGAITALAGALYADLNRYTSPVMFDWHTSGELIVFVILGGVGRLAGPLIGAGLYVLLEHWLTGLDDACEGVETGVLGGVCDVVAPLADFWKILLGVILILIILFARGGVVGALFGEKRRV